MYGGIQGLLWTGNVGSVSVCSFTSKRERESFVKLQYMYIHQN